LRTLFSARTLFILSGLFIFYATTIPWDFSHAPALDAVSWIPMWDSRRGRPPSISDLVQNVVLFVPFGFFGALSLASLRRRGPILAVAAIGLLGLLLSTVVEGLQTMSVLRSPSVSDLMTNFIGALAGAAIAMAYAARVEAGFGGPLARLARERPGLLLWLVFVVVVSAGALAPFVPSLDVGLLRASVRRLLDHPWGPKPLAALVSDALAFGAVAFLGTRELLPWLASRRPEATTGERREPAARSSRCSPPSRSP